jgi:phosphoribosylanthranilate isomerase
VTQIKICGITNREDAAFVAQCGADAVGFIFHPQSPRYVAPETVKQIIMDLPDDITKVGVFVNLNTLQVKDIAAFCSLDMVQLHGDESPAYCKGFPRSQVIKACALKEEADVEHLRAYPVRAILVDAYDPVRHGGTGERADWTLAAKVKEQHLAGGLSLANIQEAIDLVSPHAVDINSGVEGSPGRKDHQKVKKIIELVRELGGEDTGIFGR